MHITQFDNLVDNVMVEVFDLGLKINYFLNEFERNILLGVHERLHEICYDISILPLNKFGQVTEMGINVLVCMTNNQESKSDFLEYSSSSEQRTKGHLCT